MGEVGQDARAPEVTDRMGRLAEAVRKIENQVETLDEKLKPVSRGSNPPLETAVKEEGCNVPLADDIKLLENRVMSASRDLADIIDRLEI